MSRWIRLFLLVLTGLTACDFVGTWPQASAAADLEAVRARGELVWGADQEGGGPHVFPDPDNPAMLRGFEVDLAAMLAEELGVLARFQQGQWDRLPLLLGRSTDCILNGIELTAQRNRDYRCSRPYYAYALQLLARRDSPLAAFEQLLTTAPRGRWQVGVLTGSAAEIFMRSRHDLAVDVIGYDGTIDSMEQLKTGVLDAAVMDDCIFALLNCGLWADLLPAVSIRFSQRTTRRS